MSIPVPKRKRELGGSLAHVRSRHQERQLAARMARVTRGSGNKHERGDVRVERVMRLECKTTTKKSFSITRDMLTAINTAAFGSGEVPAIVVEFLNENGKPVGEVAVVPTWVLEEMVCP